MARELASTIPHKSAPGSVMAQISIVHVIFNIVCTAIMLPLSSLLVKVACKVIPGSDPVKSSNSWLIWTPEF